MRTILIGTGNRKKLFELEAFLSGCDVRILTPDALDPVPAAPQESGATFEENARIKALAYGEASGLLCIADDSGLEVDALGGRPGVHSARYAGPDATDASNNARLLDELRLVPEAGRGAAYVSVIVVAYRGRVRAVTRGTCRGRILEAPRGEGGFGYDPLFFLPESGRTFGELTATDKARISHRGKALTALLPELNALLNRMITESA